MTVTKSDPKHLPAMRLPDMPLHDPFVVADDRTRTYYLYTSNEPTVSGVDGTGTMVYRSADLRDWTRPVVVFRTAEQKGIWATEGAWAPEVHAWDGRYYLLTTLHDEDKPLDVPPANRWGTPFRLPNHMRGTITAVSDSLLGPFTVVDPARPTPPENLMTLDGTLYVDPSGQPWMVYAHEWLQTVDGTMEAIRLAPDLTGTIGDPAFLFKASDASWLTEQIPGGVPHQLAPYITDGPQLYRTPDNSLLMLWSTYEKNVVAPTAPSAAAMCRRTRSPGPATSRGRGTSSGPWSARTVATACCSAPSTAALMMILHRPFENARGKLYEMRLDGHELHVLRRCADLDGGG